MPIDVSAKIGRAIDCFVEQKLQATQETKRHLVKFVLQQTRRHIETIITSVLKESQGIETINTVCLALDAAPITYDQTVLQRVGLEDLGTEITEYRKQVKWGLLSEALREIIPDDESIITPDTLRNANKEVYNAVRVALVNGSKQPVDWEQLKKYLPTDLARRFETRKLSKAERKRQIEEEVKISIEDLHIVDVIAGLGNDPKKLTYFLQLTGQLSDEQINRIVYVSFSGLRETQTETKLAKLLKEYQHTLAPIEIASEVPTETSANSVHMKVVVPEGTTRLLVRGPWKRDIKINGNKEVEFVVILNPGEINVIQLLAYNEATQTCSPLHEEAVLQTSAVVDKSAIVEFLRALTEEMLADIEREETKKELFIKCLEESCIRYFAGNFNTGKKYVEDLIKAQKNAFIANTLRHIIKLFQKIDTMPMPFIREDEELMFFQKYCVYKIQENMKEGNPGVILANEPGLGKTFNAEAFVYPYESLIITPNSAASTWTEQEARFFKEPFLVSLASRTYAERVALLKERLQSNEVEVKKTKLKKKFEDVRQRRGVVTNIEFLRAKEGDGSADENGKIALLNKRSHPHLKRVTVVDEAHFLKNDSQQTEGISQLESDFLLLLTASPYRTSGALCKIMSKIFPGDSRFANVAAFETAFPMNDPASLKALHILVRPHVIRFLKNEVMPTVDPQRPLSEQGHALPAKKHIDPLETGVGRFTLTEEQEAAILEMFEDWQGWAEKYDRYMPSDDKARADGIRASDDRLTKEHAMRQLVNNPKYINSTEPSPKHAEAMRILDAEISEGNKAVVFCRYHEQIQTYKKLLEERGIEYAEYSGEITKQGYKKDADGREILYATDNFGNYQFTGDGEPRVAGADEVGRSMLCTDFERLTFQNRNKTKVMLATFSAASQSVTFTAAGAMIFDDVPKDYIEQYQAEDRNHRIDEKRIKKEVRYYSLLSQYSPKFIERMQEKIVEDGETVTTAYAKWFEQGPMDVVQHLNLIAQRTSFELLNNGIAAEPDLVEIERAFAM